MNIAKLGKWEVMRCYLEKHPEMFTQELCELLADRFLNVNTVRKTIKDEFPKWMREHRNNFDAIPNELL